MKVSNAATQAKPHNTASKGAATAAARHQDVAGKDVIVTIRKGDTLALILTRQGIGPTDRAAVLDALGDLIDPTALQVGDKIRLTIAKQDSRRVVTALHLDTGQAEDLTIKVGPYGNEETADSSSTTNATADTPATNSAVKEARNTAVAQADPAGPPDMGWEKMGRGATQNATSINGARLNEASRDPISEGDSGWQAATGATDNDRQAGQFVVRHSAGIVGKNFRTALQAASLPKPLIDEVVLAFKYDADAPGALPQHAAFSIIYEGVLQDGKFQAPQLRYAALNDGRKTHRIYRYQTDSRTTAFVHANGQGVAVVDLSKPLMIEAKITSPYGWRIHPVFGDRRFHEGVDFGAPKGTPVVATADGTIEDIGWRGNYGEYIRVRHDGHLETAYAHLAGFARGMQRGTQVKRGEVIGYVGRTGVATGPHLYYEVLIDGKQVDPMKAPPVVPVTLSGTQLAEFQKFVETAPQE